MKVQLNEDREIKGKQRKAGEIVIVRKAEGMRMISEKLANMVIELPENRLIAPQENRTSTWGYYG